MGPDDQVQTIELYRHDASLTADQADPMVMQRGSLIGFSDLNGDGTLEIIFDASYYEGTSYMEVEVGDAGTRTLGGGGCGA